MSANGSGKLQYRREMRRAWDVVDAKYSAEEILGSRASQAMLRFSTRASHHEFPFALSTLAGLVACTNGAKVSVFPGSSCPLMLCVFKLIGIYDDIISVVKSLVLPRLL